MISKEPRGSIDLSHHLNAVSRSRHPSPLKEIVKYMALDSMVSLAGGLPHPALFPFTNLTVSTYDPSITLDPCSGGNPAATQDISVSAIPKDADQMSLTDALQYNPGPGDITLRNWASNFTREVFQPAYDDWEIILNGGNPDEWGKVVRTLCEPGDCILCEQHAYPSAQAVWAPMGVQGGADRHGRWWSACRRSRASSLAMERETRASTAVAVCCVSQLESYAFSMT